MCMKQCMIEWNNIDRYSARYASPDKILERKREDAIISEGE